MATRLYYGNEPATLSPTVDASWETGTPQRRLLVEFKQEHSGLGFLEDISGSTALNSPAGAVDRVLAQFISPPLNGNQTISGAIKGQMKASESTSAASDLRAQVVIRVLSNDGTTVRGTLVASDTAALSSEFALNTRTNRKFPRGSPVTPTSVNALDTDRIVVEIGYRKHENNTSNRTGIIQIGNPTGTDLSEDETSTAADTPWIEFADTLVFATPNARMSSEVVRVSRVPASADVRAQMSSEVVRVAFSPVSSLVIAQLGGMSVRVASPVNIRKKFRPRIIG